MKFTTIFAIVAAAAATVGAVPAETNAERFARGLPPLPPARRATPVGSAKRGTPSGYPGGQCNTGTALCCNSLTTASNPLAKVIIGLLGIVLGGDVAVALTCSPLTILGGGGTSCTQQPVCCTGNSFNGLLVLGCSPININL